MFIKNNIRILVLIFSFILIASIVNASEISFNTYRDSYRSFETVQVNVSIENITLSRDLEVSNLVLLREDNSSISLAKSKIKVNNSFYVFYFDLPSLEEGGYRLGLTNVNYIQNGAAKIGSFFAELNVVSGDSLIVSVRPAYIFSRVVAGQDAPFSLVINN